MLHILQVLHALLQIFRSFALLVNFNTKHTVMYLEPNLQACEFDERYKVLLP